MALLERQSQEVEAVGLDGACASLSSTLQKWRTYRRGRFKILLKQKLSSRKFDIMSAGEDLTDQLIAFDTLRHSLAYLEASLRLRGRPRK